MNTPIRILLVDDHTIVREGMAMLLAAWSDVAVVGQAGDGAAAVRAYRELNPDLVLLDLALPEMDGVAVIRAVRQTCPHARFLVLTTFDHEESVYQALHAGALGYLLKTSTANDIHAAIRAVHEGKRWLSPALTRRLAELVDSDDLSEREVSVLRLLGAGLSNEAMSVQLNVSVNTVKTHLAHIYGKLGVKTRVQAIEAAHKRGLLHRP